jgi:transcriptional regulator with XRE-family HTH domain
MGFRENLKFEMAYADITVKELAYHAKVKQKTLESYLDSRAIVPSVETACRIASALNVSVEYLVTGKEYKGSPHVVKLPDEILQVMRIMQDFDAGDRRLALALINAIKSSRQ